jgi:primary-amine oxidase
MDCTNMNTERTWTAWVIVFAATVAASAASAVPCPTGTFEIDETLTTGTRWELCWEDRAAEGIVFRDVHITPPGEERRRVLKEASIAQIHVVYDDDSARRLILSEAGLGGASRVALEADDCPSGTLLSDGARNVLCRVSGGRGYAWKYEYVGALQQGYWLELTSISRTGDLTWIARWRFYDDGAIEPALGSTGELATFGVESAHGQPVGPDGAIGVGWVATSYWRLDFDIGPSGDDDLVERFEIHPSADGLTKTLSTAVLTSEGGEAHDAALKRSWRVRDSSTTNLEGHAISYHLEPYQTGHRYQPAASEAWAAADFAVTVHHPCERLAADNPATSGCPTDLAGFLDGETANGADVVLWYRTSEHHYPRDEDLPYVGTRWQSYLVIPRDWTYNNPLVQP